MKIYFTRHGQVLAEEYYGDTDYPAGDLPLTPLGRKQAEVLGNHLRSLGFHGRIFSSPYRRTTETAHIIAEIIGVGVTLLPCLREIIRTEEAAHEFRGMTLAEHHRDFPTTRETAELPYPWWEDHADTAEDVAARVKAGLSALLPTLQAEEVLFVCHGASHGAIKRKFLHNERVQHTLNANCCLSYRDTETGECYTGSTAHLPPELITFNPITLADVRKQMADAIRSAADFSAKHPHCLLHIGDTAVYAYDFYRDLIAAAKPSVILHTGDMADEYKAGRREVDVSLWKEHTAELVQIMRKSGARVITVMGNNDIESYIRQIAPDFEIIPKGETLTFGSRTACLSHEFEQLTDGDDFFYGHSLKGTDLTAETNERNGKRWFNAMWAASIHDLDTNEYRFLLFPKY